MKTQIAIILSLAVIAVHCGPVPIAPSVSLIQRHPLIPKCNAGSYICQRTPESTSFLPKCIDFPLVCDGVKDCEGGDDEANELCDDKEKLKEVQLELEELQANQANQKPAVEGVENDFSGTGFMFSVQNLVIEGGSNVKMFNQNSDNVEQTSGGAQKKADGEQEQKKDGDDSSN
ncbi:hypothetical protein TYRP_016148 [Tyrophagus putrescentiae]|nr:hypothetical protein TYRP_016148 [Tyrophagus putrescentiae]